MESLGICRYIICGNALNAEVKQELRIRSVKICVDLWPFFCRIHFPASRKCRIKGGRKISDNRKYFGNISGKQPFSEKISDLFFSGGATVSVAVRGVSRRTAGSRSVKVGLSAVAFAAKAGQTDVRVRQSLTPPGINMQLIYHERLAK
jgi:hypothetical protein